MSLDELIVRLERARGPSRELDDGISWAVSHPGFRRWTAHDESGRMTDTGALPYTDSLDAALMLVPEGWFYMVAAYPGDQPSALVGFKGTGSYAAPEIDFDVNASTPAIALCIAALKARQSSPEAEGSWALAS